MTLYISPPALCRSILEVQPPCDGDVIREENNVYGGAVNIAARIATASAPGEVLASDTVRNLARKSAGVAFDDRGEQEFKGIAEPQRLFAVRGGGGD